MTDPLERFAAMRPATPADNHWADSPEGKMALARIHHRAEHEAPAVGPHPGRRWFKPLVVISAAVVVAGGATAAVVIVSRAPSNPAQVLCLRSASPTADAAGLSLDDPTPAAALRACASQWAQLFPGDPTPAGYAVCVYRSTAARHGSAGGEQVVIPAADASAGSAAACTAAGFDPVAS